MAVLAACLGLRIGEIRGLQWGDIDLPNGPLSVRRSVYQYHVGLAKTCYSEASLPLAEEVTEVMQTCLSQAHYRGKTDWVFASNKGGLRDGDKLREKFLQPAADRAGIGKIGWHSLRHTFATALDTAGARMKVAQELMRHANIATTMDVYTGAIEKDKRAASAQVARSFLGQSNEQRLLSNPNEPKSVFDWGANCLKLNGAPERIRTSDLWFRRPTLYPTELQARIGANSFP